ncbi:MAG: hypothetical protein AAGH19_11045 [Pseudomonadota bacterium]
MLKSLDQDAQELIQAAVDGELDASGQEQFEALLTSSEDARMLFDDLTRLVDFVDQVPPPPMPDSLHGQIIEGIELPRPSGLGRFFRFEELPGFLRYGLAGAAAVALTVMVYQGGNGLDSDRGTDDLLGTMASRGDMAGGLEVDRVRFEGIAGQGEVQLIAQGESYAVAFNLVFEDPAELSLAFPGGGYRVDAFAREADSAAHAVSWTEEGLLATASGQQRFVVRLSRQDGVEPSDEAISVTLSRAGATLWSEALSTKTSPN